MKRSRGARSAGAGTRRIVHVVAAVAAGLLLPVGFTAGAMADGVDPFREGSSWPGAKPKKAPLAAQAAITMPKQRLLPPGAATTDADDEDAAPAPQRQAGPALLQGGARPSISPMPPQNVAFSSGHAPGTVVIDTAGRQLFLVQSGSQALRYPISVGRDGFTWTGTQKISRVADWPDWRPPAEMRQRDPRLPELMTGGVNNPLGAKALYLGNTLYRIHGTNDTKSIGRAASSGCFRMMNGHVIDLAKRVGPGTSVVVVSRLPATAYSAPASKSANSI